MKAGIYYDVPASTYHADPCAVPSLSSSIAKMLLVNARKAWAMHPRLNPAFEPDNDAKFDLGTAAHALLLEKDESGIVRVDAADWRTKDAKAERDAANALGKTALLEHQYQAAKQMAGIAEAYIAETRYAEDWAQARSEVTVIWEEDGVWLRCRPDRLTRDNVIAFDYKTTADASPDMFGRQMSRMGYDFQAAFYRRGLRAVTGEDPAFIFLAQEDDGTHECCLHGCSNLMLEIADLRVEQAIQTWRECMRTGKWPSYPREVCWQEPPTWAVNEYMAAQEGQA